MYRSKAQRDFARVLRNNPTDAEKHLWRFLRAQQLDGHKFRRQASIGPYTIDFICFAKKLIIELDGPQHIEPTANERDKDRDEWLTMRGYRILRFRNQQLDDNIREVIDAISDALQASPLPNPPLQGEGTNPE
jgi:5-methyltetrahydrofolate--homocysteine methyltransferase